MIHFYLYCSAESGNSVFFKINLRIRFDATIEFRSHNKCEFLFTLSCESKKNTFAYMDRLKKLKRSNKKSFVIMTSDKRIFRVKDLKKHGTNHY
jgi:hypothetical protein